MAEYTGIALQTVDAGQNVVLTETPVCGSNCIQHREGSGIVKLRGLTNNCKARFLVGFSGNIQIPTGGTVEAISVAIAVDGEPLQNTRTWKRRRTGLLPKSRKASWKWAIS